MEYTKTFVLLEDKTTQLKNLLKFEELDYNNITSLYNEIENTIQNNIFLYNTNGKNVIEDRMKLLNECAIEVFNNILQKSLKSYLFYILIINT